MTLNASAISDTENFFALKQAMANAARDVDALLERILPRPHGLHERIHKAVRYAIFPSGKRLRPFLVLRSAALFDVDPAGALHVGAAVEALHTYSLIHDDLPCMDDDDLRRGRPTTHIAFDEATAVLAGDALLTVAFEILVNRNTHPSGDIRCQLVDALAKAAGQDGMVGGQVIDLAAETTPLGLEDTITLQTMKTGAMLEFCCAAGPILAGAAPEDHDRLRAYARDIGLLFQITDDLLDVLSTSEKAGKSVRKDQEKNKATLVSLLGIDGARSKAAILAQRSARALASYGTKATELQDLPLFLLDRES